MGGKRWRCGCVVQAGLQQRGPHVFIRRGVEITQHDGSCTLPVTQGPLANLRRLLCAFGGPCGACGKMYGEQIDHGVFDLKTEGQRFTCVLELRGVRPQRRHRAVCIQSSQNHRSNVCAGGATIGVGAGGNAERAVDRPAGALQVRHQPVQRGLGAGVGADRIAVVVGNLLQGDNGGKAAVGNHPRHVDEAGFAVPRGKRLHVVGCDPQAVGRWGGGEGG